MNIITTRDLLKVSLRLLFIQTAWSLSSMQSEGIVYCISPALKKLFPEEKRLKRILKHYHAPINTHPFLVSLLAGAAIRLEEEGRSTKTILAYLRTTMGPLAALGDPFFQAATAFASVLAGLITLIAGILPGIVTLLVVFNTIHLFLRVYGIFVGYKMGEQSFAYIGKKINATKTLFLRAATGLLSGLFIGGIVYRYGVPQHNWWILPVVGLVSLALATLLNLKRAVWTYVLPLFLLGSLILEVFI